MKKTNTGEMNFSLFLICSKSFTLKRCCSWRNCLANYFWKILLKPRSGGHLNRWLFIDWNTQFQKKSQLPAPVEQKITRLFFSLRLQYFSSLLESGTGCLLRRCLPPSSSPPSASAKGFFKIHLESSRSGLDNNFRSRKASNNTSSSPTSSSTNGARIFVRTKGARNMENLKPQSLN